MSTNPVTRRVGMLSNQWLDVAADDRARVLCWKFAADETRMLAGFLALELDERTAEHNDLFVELESEFASAEAHGRHLGEELLAQYRREQPQLRSEGLLSDWPPPEPFQAEPPLRWCMRACASFVKHHALPRHLVLVLRPAQVRDPEAYRAWLLEFARAAPANVRAIAVDCDDALHFDELTAEDAERVRTCQAGLDMPGAFGELHESSGQLATPGGRFRDCFLRLSAAIGARDLEGAERIAQTALAIAVEQQWFALCVPVHMLLGTTHAADKRTEQARAHHRAAEQAALRGRTEGVPEQRASCVALRLQSRVALGASLITCEAFDEAATVFQDTLPLAVADGEQLIWLDCHRLAAYCHERAAKPEPALDWGLAGVQAAKRLPPDVLANSCLPQLGAALLRLCEAEGRDELAAQVRLDVDALTGGDAWRSAPGEPAPRAA